MVDTTLGGKSVDNTIGEHARELKECQLRLEKRKQPGIGFPSAGLQKHLLVIRLNLAPAQDEPAPDETVRAGLLKLCCLLAQCDNGTKRVDVLGDHGKMQRKPISDFDFSATIGFGSGFFEKLNIPAANRPKKLWAMPDNQALGDVKPYILEQTDMIIQLGSSEEFINRWVLENVLHPVVQREPVTPLAEAEVGDIVSAIAGWATIADVHAGFQRLDGRNLQGFNDGVSNPRRLSPLFDEWVWTTEDDEGSVLKDGTYLVFQKIIHNLDLWRALDLRKQEMWVGRSKGTGLLLGTLPEREDEQLAKDLLSTDDAVRKCALKKWEPLFKEQSEPVTGFFDHEDGDPNGQPIHAEIPNRCPAWSHVRKANPREEDGKLPRHLIFRRGYPFMENGIDDKISSGLLFICFQRDIEQSFEFIKKNWFGNERFPVPSIRPFTALENELRNQNGRSGAAAEETGREGLAGPSANGVNPGSTFLAIEPLGGGYYFCPPIPNGDPSRIGQQFFEVSREQLDANGPETLAKRGVSIDQEDRMTVRVPPKVTTLGSYLIIARYNREKWNRLSETDQLIAREVSLGLFPIDTSKKLLLNNGAQAAVEDLSGDPLTGVRLLHTFHTGIFATLAEIEKADKEKKARPLQELSSAVNELFGVQEPPPGAYPKDPGIGWVAIVEAAQLGRLIGRMGSKGGPLWNIYDIEIISLNDDQTTEDIYDFMTPVSWRK